MSWIHGIKRGKPGFKYTRGFREKEPLAPWRMSLNMSSLLSKHTTSHLPHRSLPNQTSHNLTISHKQRRTPPRTPSDKLQTAKLLGEAVQDNGNVRFM